VLNEIWTAVATFITSWAFITAYSASVSGIAVWVYVDFARRVLGVGHDLEQARAWIADRVFSSARARSPRGWPLRTE
jgi:hypothetical protein